jgi:hypothetical protein
VSPLGPQYGSSDLQTCERLSSGPSIFIVLNIFVPYRLLSINFQSIACQQGHASLSTRYDKYETASFSFPFAFGPDFSPMLLNKLSGDAQA